MPMDNKENNERSYIKVKKESAQEFLKLISKLMKKNSVINKRFKILREDNDILFPVVESAQASESLIRSLKGNINYSIVNRTGEINLKYKHISIQEALKSKIPKKFQDLIPNSFDIVGEIVIIEFIKLKLDPDDNIEPYKRIIAQCVKDFNKHVKSVYEKKSEIQGTFRLRDIELLCGENKTETVHRENNCVFKLDVRKTFFTPRLVYERKRISTCCFKENEIIIDLFAGVGPFSIQIAKNNKVMLYAFDINPAAYNYLVENIKLNKLKGIIIPYNIDVKDLFSNSSALGPKLKNKADRIIMNLPENSIEYLDVVCFLSKPSETILHIYQFCEKPDPIEKAKCKLNNKLKQFNWAVDKILNARFVKSFSPKSDLIALDATIKQNMV